MAQLSFHFVVIAAALNRKVLKNLLIIVHLGSTLLPPKLLLTCTTETTLVNVHHDLVMTHLMAASVFLLLLSLFRVFGTRGNYPIPVIGSWHPWSRMLLVLVLSHKLLLLSFLPGLVSLGKIQIFRSLGVVYFCFQKISSTLYILKPKVTYLVLIYSLSFKLSYPNIYNSSSCLFPKRYYLDFSFGSQISQNDVLEYKIISYISSAQSQWLNITFGAKSKLHFRLYRKVLVHSYLSYLSFLPHSYFPLLISVFSPLDLTKTSI